MDGHETHEAHPIRRIIFEKMDEMEVIIFCFPSKCTHKLQPLDVAVFSGVQREWQTICHAAISRNYPINRYTVIPEYLKARSQCIKKQLIQSAFKKTGIYPFNPDVFTDTDFAPSNGTSSKAHVPKSFPPEVRSSSPAIPSDAEAEISDENSDKDTSESEDYNSDFDMDYIPPASPDSPCTETAQNSNSDIPESSLSSIETTSRSGLLHSLHNIQTRAESTLHFTRSFSADAAEQIRSPPVTSFEHDSNLTHEEMLAALRNSREQLYFTYQAMHKSQAEAQAAHAHCTLLKQELDDVRAKLSVEKTKKAHGSTRKPWRVFLPASECEKSSTNLMKQRENENALRPRSRRKKKWKPQRVKTGSQLTL